MNNELLKYLSNKVQEEYEVIANDLARGSARDYGDYKHACGIIRGLSIVNQILNETSERMENSDD